MIRSFFSIMALASVMLLTAPQAQAALSEVWGGMGIEIEVDSRFSARLQFDCATGSVQAGRWPTGQSRINAVGLLTRETGVRPPDGRLTNRPMKTIYKANIDQLKGLMTLSVKVGNERAVIYKLVKNRAGDIRRCM